MSDKKGLEKKLDQPFEAINELMARLNELQGKYFEMEIKQDYLLTSTEGEKVKLSSLFGNAEDLILVHNMDPATRATAGRPYFFLSKTKSVQVSNSSGSS